MKGARLRLAVLGLLASAGAVAAQPDRSPDELSAVRAADHALELGGGRLRISTTWALQRPLEPGEQVRLAQPLHSDAELSSNSFELVREAAAGAGALRAKRALAAGLHTMELVVPNDAHRPILPMPRSSAINRVRLSRALRFSPAADSGLQQRLGIVIASDIAQAERRGADRALDGPGAHRRLGAIYVRGMRAGQPSGLSGTFEASKNHHGLTLAWVGLLALTLLVALGFVHRRLTRAVDNERVDAFLERELPELAAGTPTSSSEPHSSRPQGTTGAR